MADKKISELDAITGANTAADDFFIVVDSSGSTTKKISRAELNNAIERDVLSTVDIDGGTIDGTTIGGTTAAAGTFTDLTATGTLTGLISEVSDDTTPQLGGALDTNGNNINFGDDDRARFGVGTDLQIYHSSSDDTSYIFENGGTLSIQATNFNVLDGSGSNMLTFTNNDGPDLFHNGSKKLEVTTSGIDVQGNAKLSGTGSILQFDKNGSGTDNVIFYDNSTAANNLYLGKDSSNIIYRTGGSERMRLDSSGRLGIGKTPTSKPLEIYSGSNPAIRIQNSTTGTTNSDGFLLEQNGSNTLLVNYESGYQAFYTGGSERMRITSGGNVLVGKTNTASNVVGAFILNNGLIRADVDGGPVNVMNRKTSDGDVAVFQKDGASVGVIGTQNWGIGTASPATNLHIKQTGNAGNNWDEGSIKIGDAVGVEIGFNNIGSGRASFTSLNNAGTTNNLISFGFGAITSSGEPTKNVMTLNQSGDVLVGKTSPNSTVQGVELSPNGYGIFTPSNNHALLLNRTGTDGAVVTIRKDGTTVGTIGNNTDFYVASADGMGARFTNNQILPCDESGATQNGSRDLGSSSGRFRDLYLSGGINNPSGALTFDTGGSEAMRIDASGNLLVGTTSTSASQIGGRIFGGGRIVTSTTSEGHYFRRNSTDGTIVEFAKDGTTVGVMGAQGGDLYVGNGDTTLKFYAAGDAILPRGTDGAARSNAVDLGNAGNRFDDIYAQNTTIQTSDESEKQQIASLTDAEITAAKAISALFKTFKWNDSVASKGDAARTHTGVIAQQVEQALTDAGLNAGNYAFFINGTWTDDDGVEQSIKGIRYAELLSFIGAATEQRLSNIESRLAALEAN